MRRWGYRFGAAWGWVIAAAIAVAAAGRGMEWLLAWLRAR